MRPQPREPLPEQSPRRRRRQHTERAILARAQRQISPTRRDCSDAAVDQPTPQRDLAALGPPPEHIQFDASQLARRGGQPHAFGERINNMSSSTPTRRAPARRI
jgi:hypothetical protein